MMKKLLLLLFISIIISSCSKDNPVSSLVTPVDTVYSHAGKLDSVPPGGQGVLHFTADSGSTYIYRYSLECTPYDTSGILSCFFIGNNGRVYFTGLLPTNGYKTIQDTAFCMINSVDPEYSIYTYGIGCYVVIRDFYIFKK